MQQIDPRRGPAQVDELIARRERFKGPRFRADAANQRTAALLDGQGKLFIEPANLDAIVRRLDAEGFRIHMHAMGDGAVRAGLDAIEAAVGANGARDRRRQLAHIGVANPADLDAGPRALALDPSFCSIETLHGRVVTSSDWPSPSMNPFGGMQVALTLLGGKPVYRAARLK
jgi:predicted amidohydrolase YtcJ